MSPQQINSNGSHADTTPQCTPLQQEVDLEIAIHREIIHLPQNLYDGLCTPDEAARIRFREQTWQKDR